MPLSQFDTLLLASVLLLEPHMMMPMPNPSSFNAVLFGTVLLVSVLLLE